MNEEEKALIPVEQKQVIFYDDEITAVLVEEKNKREVFFSIRQMCDLLGVSYQGQIRRITDDPVLSKQVKGVNVMLTPSSGRGGGPQVTNCLPIDYLNGWLFGMNANRVKPEIRDRLILYQEKCYKALAEAFQEGRLTTDYELDELLNTSDSEAAQAYRMLQALVKLARNQVILEAQLVDQSRRLDLHDKRLLSYVERLEEVEAVLGDTGRYITPDQAMQISQAVKAIALEMGKQSKRNEYGGVYGELYRRYKIPNYKVLPAHKFNDAITWLKEWYASLVSDAPF